MQHLLGRSRPVPVAGQMRRRRSRWVTVVQRKRAARDLDAKTLAGREHKSRWLECKFPVMNFVSGVSFTEQPRTPGDSNRDKFSTSVIRHAHDLCSEVCMCRRSCCIKPDTRLAQNLHRVFERFRSVDEQVVSQLESALIEDATQSLYPARSSHRHLGIIDE